VKLVVFGASGRTGRLLVAGALERGHEVTAFTRTPEVLGDLATRCARVVRGDIVDRVMVAEALSGQEAAVYAVGPGPGESTAITADGALRVIRVMQKYGLRRLIVLSAAGAAAEEEEAPRSFLARLFRPRPAPPADEGDMRRMEISVRQSELDWTLVRPSRLTDGPATGSYRSGPGLTLPDARPIARADVAAYVLDQLDTDLNVQHAVALSG
jgi:putative NADH-flavin reductase